MSTKVLPGYPHSLGGSGRRESVVSHKGPSNYSSFSGGPPQAGGDVLTAAECGLKFIDSVEISGDDSGTYDVVPFFPISSDGPAKQIILAWFVLARSSQPNGQNLSSLRVRIRVIGIG